MYYGYIIIVYNNKIKYIQPPILVVFILNLKYILFIVTYLLEFYLNNWKKIYIIRIVP